MPVRLNNSRVRGGCASASRRSATRPRFQRPSSFRDDSKATRKRSKMMSTDSLAKPLADSSGKPEPADGDEILDIGHDQPAADDAGSPKRLRTRLARLLAHVILPAAALL